SKPRHHHAEIGGISGSARNRPDAQPRQTAPPCRSPASSPGSESDPHTAASSADRLLPLLSSVPRVASRCPRVALPGNLASPVPVLHFAGCVPATLPGVYPGAACPPHQTCRSPRPSECCNAPGLLESDSSVAFVAAPKTYAAAATPAGRVAPTAESILRESLRLRMRSEEHTSELQSRFD